MNRQQKWAWCMVISMGIAFIASLIATAFLAGKHGFPEAFRGFAFMGIGGLGGLAGLFIKKDPGPVSLDERDRTIQLHASRAGFAISYLVMGLACMGTWGYYRRAGAVPVDLVSWIWFAGFMSAFFAMALYTVIAYHEQGG